MLRLRPAPAPPAADIGTFTLDDDRLASLGFTRQSLGEEIARRSWFHSFDFGDGLGTPGRDVTRQKLAVLDLPDVTDRSVIDIGAYDGFFSFEAERRGASRVVASDHWAWTWPGEDARRNFELVHTILDSNVETLQVPAEHLDGQQHGTFDVTLFLGVLYHAPDMMQYLRAVRSVTSGMLVLETVVDALDINRPTAVFYPRGTFPGDDSNHWGPNPACVEEMLHRVGFDRVERGDLWIRASRTRGRMVFHAWV
jgi:tRNA (mo5U34)-methyltransferase